MVSYSKAPEYCRGYVVYFMVEKFISFVNRNDLFILTTHDPADADGIGAQIVLTCILRDQGKQSKIINAGPMPEHIRFMDPQGLVEQWNEENHGALPEQSAVFMLDTADLHNIGAMRDPVCRAKDIFVIDHHEFISESFLAGICDSKAASTCELAIELADTMGAPLDSHAAFAAYVGIVYDTGFFSYQKTGARTFQAALALLKLNVNPNEAYRQLCENASAGALLLQKKALSSLAFHCGGQVATQILRLEDFAETGALPEETDGLVNIPLKSREVIISLLLKESPDKKIRCSLRSKGTVDVAKIAHALGGGGHVNAAGFKSSASVDQTLEIALAKIAGQLDVP